MLSTRLDALQGRCRRQQRANSDGVAFGECRADRSVVDELHGLHLRIATPHGHARSGAHGARACPLRHHADANKSNTQDMHVSTRLTTEKSTSSRCSGSGRDAQLRMMRLPSCNIAEELKERFTAKLGQAPGQGRSSNCRLLQSLLMNENKARDRSSLLFLNDAFHYPTQGGVRYFRSPTGARRSARLHAGGTIAERAEREDETKRGDPYEIIHERERRHLPPHASSGQAQAGNSAPRPADAPRRDRHGEGDAEATGAIG